MTTILVCQLALTVLLACIILIRPSLTKITAGKILAFVAICVLPALCVLGGTNFHMQRSEQTQFCISCHAMAPYGKSLYIDNPAYIPAQHFQNHRVPSDQACYACHADYTIYGPLKDKLSGLTRVYRQYVTAPPNPIRVKGGYNNRQCLHCHLGARNFEENPVHSAMLDSLKSNEVSCLTSGCHDMTHAIDSLNTVKFWGPAQ